jgi:hypothetical protein
MLDAVRLGDLMFLVMLGLLVNGALVQVHAFRVIRMRCRYRGEGGGGKDGGDQCGNVLRHDGSLAMESGSAALSAPS